MSVCLHFQNFQAAESKIIIAAGHLGRQPDVLEAVRHGGVGGVEGGGVARRVGEGAHCRRGQLSPGKG